MSTLYRQMEQDTSQDQAVQMSSCCSTTEDGSAICVLPQDGNSAGCACHSSQVMDVHPIHLERHLNVSEAFKNLWKRLRGGVMFGVACATSPCCTPLFVPLFASLLAGTPVAALLSHYLGWVYGGLTLVSIVSFVVAWRWMRPTSSIANANLH